MNILILGASGMLGNAIFSHLSKNSNYSVSGTVRSSASALHFPSALKENLVKIDNLNDGDALADLLGEVKPDIVVNCVGLIKQLSGAKNPLVSIPINSILPHRLAKLCNLVGARLIHFSTDCVFSGKQGMYKEADFPDANDVYGKTKLLGEVEYSHTVTLRTSIIGHELAGTNSLINWFLSQDGEVSGYTKAVFSGLPTCEIARIIDEYVIPNTGLHGLYHLSANPIDKAALLRLVNEVYDKGLVIKDDESVVLDRSLDSTRFRLATGFKPDSWSELIAKMHQFG